MKARKGDIKEKWEYVSKIFLAQSVSAQYVFDNLINIFGF